MGTRGDLIVVPATNRWTDAGVAVEAGETLIFEAEGIVRMSPDPNDRATPDGSSRLAPDAPLRETAAGTLIARIGNSAPIAIGARRTLARAPASGRVYLGVNDDHLADNSGEFRVLVTIEPR